MVAQEKFPWMDPDQARKELLAKHVFVWNECEAIIWQEARRLAIVEEARRQCAMLKLQSVYRGHVVSKDYRRHIDACKMMQNAVRMYNNRCAFLVIVERKRKEEARRRREIAERRRARRAALLFREARDVNGTLNIITARHDSAEHFRAL